jgi:hypothetical protein
MNEKEKAEAISRAARLQQGESEDIKELQEELKEACNEEAKLYTARGYGGYITTGEVQALRQAQEEFAERITELRSRVYSS